VCGFVQAPSRDERLDLHFVAFVQHHGSLYELGNYIHRLLKIDLQLRLP